VALQVGRKNIAPGASVHVSGDDGIKEALVIADTRDQEEGKPALHVQRTTTRVLQ
jgi:hypothetical protein